VPVAPSAQRAPDRTLHANQWKKRAKPKELDGAIPDGYETRAGARTAYFNKISYGFRLLKITYSDPGPGLLHALALTCATNAV
jgi:hypothetical protein